jgi:hypothetical protein
VHGERVSFMGIRTKVSNSDFAAGPGYIKRAFVVKAARRPPRTYESPVWMGNDAEVAQFIRKMFPRAGKFGSKCGCVPCSNRQNMSRRLCRCRYCKGTIKAIQWHAVIAEWFSRKLPDAEIETKYRWKPGTCGSIVQKIRRVIAGERQDGLPRTGKPRGRPKKIAVPETIIPDNHTRACGTESTRFTNS